MSLFNMISNGEFQDGKTNPNLNSKLLKNHNNLAKLGTDSSRNSPACNVTEYKIVDKNLAKD